MTALADLDLPRFEYLDPEMSGERFHATMREVRAAHWLAASPLGTFVLDRAAAAEVLRSRSAVFPGMEVARLFGIDDGPLHEAMARNLICRHGEDHRRLRNLVNPAFKPKAVDRFRPAMRRYLEALWAPVAPRGRCEVVAALAKPYPARVIATVMGAPLEDAARLHEWSHVIQRQFDAASIVQERGRIEAAVVEFEAYCRALIATRRADPGDDLVSVLIAAEEAGDRLSEDELVHLVLNVLIGGVDTTQSQLAQAIRLFALHPGQWDSLRDDPDLAGRAVDEVLRFEPITPFTARMTTEPITLKDVEVPAGTLLMVSVFDANRDPATYVRPEVFDVAADRGGARPMTFGAGIHHCLGWLLARAELEEALRFLAGEVHEWALDGEPRLDGVAGIHGVEALPVRFSRRGGA